MARRPCRSTNTQAGPRYETSPRSCATTVTWGPRENCQERVASNVAIANVDAHAKNFHFFTRPTAGYTLVLPATYQQSSDILMPMASWRSQYHDGARVNAQDDIQESPESDVVSEAGARGLRRPASEECVTEVFEAVSASIAITDGDESVLSSIRAQLTRVNRTV